jgi:hypothetical protein
MEKFLSEKAKAAEFTELIFNEVLLPRTEEKFRKGLRTLKGDIPNQAWDYLSEKYGNEFLLSTYTGAEHCVVATPKALHGMLTAELPDWLAAALTASHQLISTFFNFKLDGK